MTIIIMNISEISTVILHNVDIAKDVWHKCDILPKYNKDERLWLLVVPACDKQRRSFVG